MNRLQKAFARSKEQGLIDYIHWLDNNNGKMNILFEQMRLENVSKEVMDVAEKGASGFWRNLINFLLAFVATMGIFNNKKDKTNENVTSDT